MPYRSVVNKIRNIIIGNINHLLGKNKEISNPRMEICNRCDHAREIFKFGKICDQCGCLLSAKTTVENEHCKLNKW